MGPSAKFSSNLRAIAVKRFALFVLLTLIPTLRADNWPQWRGPTNDGVSKETGLPTKFDTTKNMAWSLKLPGRSRDLAFLIYAVIVGGLIVATYGMAVWASFITY